MKPGVQFFGLILAPGILTLSISLPIAGQAQGISRETSISRMDEGLLAPAGSFVHGFLLPHRIHPDVERKDHRLDIPHGPVSPDLAYKRSARRFAGDALRVHDEELAARSENTRRAGPRSTRDGALDLRRGLLEKGMPLTAADTIVEAWVRNYDAGSAPSPDNATGIAVDSSGNIYVTGYSTGSGTSYDFATIKYNAAGVEQWVARYNGPGSSADYAVAIAVDAGGNVLVTGTSLGSGTANDCATIKYNPSGVVQWVARYNGPVNGDDGAAGIGVDKSGNVYVTGTSRDTGFSYARATIKYNASGVEQWVARYIDPGAAVDFGIAVAIDSAGNVYATGDSYESGNSFDYSTIKYNTAGVEQWTAHYNGPGNADDLAGAIAADNSGNVYVTGYSAGSGTSDDYATIKYNAAGVEQWVARHNGPGNSEDVATAIAVDSSGHIYVTGYSTGLVASADYGTIKYDASGVEQWVARYDGPAHSEDGAVAIGTDDAGNVYVTGLSRNAGTTYDYATVKYNAAGQQQWAGRYSGPGNLDDVARAVGVDNSGNVYVTGYTYSSGTSYDYATVKYNAAGLETWVARFDGPGYPDNLARAIALDSAGNVYVTGSSYGELSREDFATIKYDASGAEQWVARYNGPGNSADNGIAIAVDRSGHVYVTGSSTGAGASDDYATVLYDASGIQQWVARYDGPGHAEDAAKAISVDNAGNAYVTGSSSDSGGVSDYATVKYDGSGQEQWVSRYNGPAHLPDYANAIAVDDSANVYVTGESGNSGVSYDYATIKYNVAGQQLWATRYNGPADDNDDALAIAVGDSGNVYVTGYSSSGGFYYDYATVKYNAAGVELWAARYNGPADDDDFATDLAVDNSGNVYVTGGSIGPNYSFDYATVKYGASGQEQWVARYDGPENSDDNGSSVAVDSAGDVYVTGPSGEGDLSYDFATVKYSTTGAEQWVARYDGPGNTADFASAIAVDRSGNAYVTGWSERASGRGYTTIKYEQLVTAADENAPQMPTTFALNQNYPNPFNPSTRIRFSVPTVGNVRLGVFNVLGQEVVTLVNEVLTPGAYERTFDATGLAGGVYFYRMQSGIFMEHKKMLLMK